MKTLQQQLREAFPQLTERDFGTYYTDLYVVAYPFVCEWLASNYEFYSNVTTFKGSPEATNWNGAGRLCLDIPFAAE